MGSAVDSGLVERSTDSVAADFAVVGLVEQPVAVGQLVAVELDAVGLKVAEPAGS